MSWARQLPKVPPELVGASTAASQLQRASWAAATFAGFDGDRCSAIVAAVGDVAQANAQRFAADTVATSGAGVEADKALLLRTISDRLTAHRSDTDYVSIKLDPEHQTIAIPKPVGVVLAAVGVVNPVATIYWLTLCAILTRNAIVFVADPEVHELTTATVTLLADAAVGAGAPDGCVQVVQRPSPELTERLLAAGEVDLLFVAGDERLAAEARRSGTPALTTAAGNVAALVTATADVAATAEALLASKSFDNSLLSTNESTLIVEQALLPALLGELEQRGAFLLSAEQVAQLRSRCARDGALDASLSGRSAAAVAATAGLEVPSDTRLLIAPVEFVAPEDPLVYAKRCPLLALVAVANLRRGIAEARAVERLGEGAQSAVIHSREPGTIVAFGAALPVKRIVVNGPGASGEDISPSAVAGPEQFVRWTECAVGGEVTGTFDELQPVATAIAATPQIGEAENTEQN